MRIVYSWLKEYIDLELSAEELAERLTHAIEVEAVERFARVPQRVVVGEIITRAPHPHKSNLSVVGVDPAAAAAADCRGARNIAVGRGCPWPYPGWCCREEALLRLPNSTGLSPRGCSALGRNWAWSWARPKAS